ncbi:ABC transporter ATP-binding protein [Desulfosarcina alkanivorans]|uniref:ABC transporter ATP-binding protein n=1 Tax=Desulfosarcina alkanivorans TaxID=571177 RepID=A0A5K7YQZ6_9BACT|nr:ABC transporter ATP-binding protein [Desulfosarcina alkanivorans]BBO71666.1 ABC transporter ATP-binding protein [Desulfosarcina alkanivorans]
MILETQGVSKFFGGLKAVNDVSLTIREGQIFGLIGPNGAGKTTFQNCIAGTFPPTQGSVRFKGRDITGYKAHRCCHQGMARTYQIVRSFPQMSVLENVMVGAVFGNHRKGETPEGKASEMLDYVEFPMAHDLQAQNLNTMQLKRLELARALASNCEFLLLDEVAAGLTPAELDDITALILRIRDSGVTILIVEHLMKLIMSVCDQIAVLNFGEKIADGTPAEITRDEGVAKAYLGADALLH